MGSRALAVAVAVVGCYSPSPPQGVPCSPDGDCPSGQSCVVGLCEIASASTPDAPPHGSDAGVITIDAETIDATPGAFELSGARWELPCMAAGSDGFCPCGKDVQGATVPAGGRVVVTAEIHGFSELAAYTGGSALGSSASIGDAGAYAGGSASSTVVNIYKLVVSSPPQTIFVNHKTGSASVATVDYALAFEVDGGAKVSFIADGQDGQEITNGAMVSVPGVSDPPQPYDGQFLRLDVQSVEPAP